MNTDRLHLVSLLCEAVAAKRLDAAAIAAHFIELEHGLTKIETEDPFYRGPWHGQFVSIDGTPADDPSSWAPTRNAALLIVLASGQTRTDDWDGISAGVVLLRDGRFMAWESTWGPTGSGFHADAYGGDADIGFASTLYAACHWLSEQSRELLVGQLPAEVLR